jgi:hypothetical protein
VVEEKAQLQTDEEDLEQQQQHVHCIARGFKSFPAAFPTLIQRRPLLGI